ncbi:MAG: hypothetical protein NPINA01_21110 [Nitrospinaceae bacterium]|nr:MAG: hypothetical protein NPINA01_21110 [Nitrospinaceae bacterium]
MIVTGRLIKVLLICPFNVMVVIPGLLLWISRQTGLLASFNLGFNLYRGILGGFFIAIGMIGAYFCVALFTDHGDGTPAPWDPPKNLVVEGIYRHVRNPMIASVFCVLLGEFLLSGYPLLLLWFLFFVAANLLYIPLIEEPQLLKRFGEPYRLYLKNVPRWIPKKSFTKGYK